jgi:hypothetical protein
VTPDCQSLNAFADGELAAADHPRFLDHLGQCTACQTELVELLLLEALLQPDEAADPRWRTVGTSLSLARPANDPQTVLNDALRFRV